MTTKNIITADEALIVAPAAHPNWYRDVTNLNTSVLASLPFDRVEDHPALVRKLRLGMRSVTEAVLRFNKKATDKNSFVLEASDLPNLLKMNPYIQTILLPSSNNESSKYWSFIKYLDENKIRHTLPKKVKDGESFILTCNRKVECIIANSTSRNTLGAQNADVLKKFKKVIAA